jgi:hypothetical protein
MYQINAYAGHVSDNRDSCRVANQTEGFRIHICIENGTVTPYFCERFQSVMNGALGTSVLAECVVQRECVWSLNHDILVTELLAKKDRRCSTPLNSESPTNQANSF